MVDVTGNLPPEPEPGAMPPKIELFVDHDALNVHVDFANIGDEFLQHDKIALAKLSEAELKEQSDARALLWKHVLTYWEQSKANGWDCTRPEWESVTGMLEFVASLSENAEEALPEE